MDAFFYHPNRISKINHVVYLIVYPKYLIYLTIIHFNIGIFKRFESNCVEFLLYLLREIPSINTYLHQIYKRTGWLPIFRVLNIFQSKNYTEEPIKK